MPMAPLLGLAAFLLLEWGEEKGLPSPTPHLAVWQSLVAVQVIVWTMFATAGFRGLGRLRTAVQPSSTTRRHSRLKQTVAFVALIYVVMAVLFVIGGVKDLRNPFLLPGQGWKVPLLHLVGAVAMLPFLVGLKWTQLACDDEKAWSTTAADIERLQQLRRFLRTATASIGVVIALALVSTGILREAVEAADFSAVDPNGANHNPLPQSFVIVYGAWLTGVLAAIYLYVFAALDGRGRSIIDAAAPLLDPKLETSEAFATRTKLRRELAEQLEVGGDPRKNLEGLVAVFTPLIAALLGLVGV